LKNGSADSARVARAVCASVEIARFSFLAPFWTEGRDRTGFWKDTAYRICSKKMILSGPAARGGYFFAKAVSTKRDPSLAMLRSGRRSCSDRLFLKTASKGFQCPPRELGRSQSGSARQITQPGAKPRLAGSRRTTGATLRERYIYFTPRVKLWDDGPVWGDIKLLVAESARRHAERAADSKRFGSVGSGIGAAAAGAERPSS